MGVLLIATSAWIASGNTSVRNALTPTLFSQDFMSFWQDGKAELAGYDLTQARYGELRKGKAVTVFVSEQMNDKTRVKADFGRHDASDVFDVMKLNLVEDFQTGIYDYNVMTSVFARLGSYKDSQSGSLAKVSFSMQEWCGHIYEQLLFDQKNTSDVMHSYFDGEADRREVIGAPKNAMSADALFLWARHMASPSVKAGEKTNVSILPRLKDARFLHKSVSYQSATLWRDAELNEIKVAAGTFQTRLAHARIGELTMTFWVEEAFPHRLIKWERSDGTKAELRGSKRMKYWELNQEGHEKFLKDLGL